MFQYKAILISTKEVVAEGHTLQDVENEIVSFRRGQKKGLHTKGNEKIQIFHVQRNQKEGTWKAKEELIKIV